MTGNSLNAMSLDRLLEHCVDQARARISRHAHPQVAISPYRFNPLGAHIDHQGGSVLARSLDQYTIVCFWPSDTEISTLHSNVNQGRWEHTSFTPAQLSDQFGWDAMARASYAALAQFTHIRRGIDAVVFGTLISGGLSSSASVILAYLSALATVNDVSLSARDLVELSRRVENDYRGLNNGIQDQMSIAFAQKNHLVKLDMPSVSATPIADVPNYQDDVQFLMCYSGVSRNLTGSNFNTRVAECQQAAALLDPAAAHLGQVRQQHRDDKAIAKLPPSLGRRAKHVYSEMQRVEQGCIAWRKGNWQAFGRLMNASCQSSIHDYESGSVWLKELHEIASGIDGVYGNRFSGGGYGGCLFMLVNKKHTGAIAKQVIDEYLTRYPDKQGLAFVNIAQSESTVRVVQL